jgi:hypothetical protein
VAGQGAHIARVLGPLMLFAVREIDAGLHDASPQLPFIRGSDRELSKQDD